MRFCSHDTRKALESDLETAINIQKLNPYNPTFINELDMKARRFVMATGSNFYRIYTPSYNHA